MRCRLQRPGHGQGVETVKPYAAGLRCVPIRTAVHNHGGGSDERNSGVHYPGDSAGNGWGVSVERVDADPHGVEFKEERP